MNSNGLRDNFLRRLLEHFRDGTSKNYSKIKIQKIQNQILINFYRRLEASSFLKNQNRMLIPMILNVPEGKAEAQTQSLGLR